MSQARGLANIGAEEGPAWREHAREPAVASLALRWQRLLSDPPFDWLQAPPGQAWAWLATPEAEAWARENGDSLCGASAAVVAQVHDKTFALELARRAGLEPPPLRGLPLGFPPEELTQAAVEAALAAWPDWARAAFTLKPRWGTSGRGRVAGLEGRLDAAGGRALPRLAERGGAVLEPWLTRRADWSTQLLVEGDGQVRMLGTLEQLCSGAGVVRGHRGSVDVRGRVASSGDCDEELRSAALETVLAAVEAGYRGPCGVDAFEFSGPEGASWLRPLVELNARFTLGTVVLAELRRALPRIVEALGLEPGERVGFVAAADGAALRGLEGEEPHAEGSLLRLAEALPVAEEDPSRPAPAQSVIYVSRDVARLDRLAGALLGRPVGSPPSATVHPPGGSA